jgi:hypothetical protein
MQQAMIRVHKFYEDLNDGMRFKNRTWPGGYYLIMQVHDELVSDMPSPPLDWIKKPYEYNLPIAREVQRLMELGGEGIGIPTPTSCEYHPVHWGEGITI